MEKIPDQFNFETSPLRELYIELGVTTPLELSRAYNKLEQPLFISGEWDYDNPSQPQNIIKEKLEAISEGELSDEEKEWRNEILWFWYHHAISVSNWKKDKEKMRFFSEKALEFQDNPNILTKTMYLLSHDQIEEALEWVDSKKGDEDEDTAREMIKNYKELGWLWPTE